MSTSPLPRLRVRVRRVPGVPVISARILLWGGSRLEEIPGQSLLTGRLLTEGTRRRSWDEIAADVEDLGMVLQSFGTHEALGVSVDGLSIDWRTALETLAEMTFEPTFPAERCAWLTRQAQGEIESYLDQPDTRTTLAFLDQLYHPHPYGRFLQGDPESLGRLTPDNLAAFHGRALDWGGVVTVTGEIDEDAVLARIESLFGDLAGEGGPRPTPPPPEGLDARRLELRLPDAEQATLLMGHLTTPRRHPDGVAMALLGVVLGAGAGLAGRLPERIREREGLAYEVGVATTSGAGFEAGRLAISVGTSPRTVEAAERAVREELEKLITDGVAADELEEARAYLLGRDPFRRETARQWADLMAEAVFYDRPIDRPEWVAEQLRRLTREEVEAVARRWIRPADLRVTVGLPE